jgi:16S rRNA (guanine527-N7)-methyltransferase
MIKQIDVKKELLISADAEKKLQEFERLLLKYNALFNLTSITDHDEIWAKHFLDSASGAFLFKKGASVAEVGSGAGFPSIVLKLIRDDLTFTLFESVGKKCEFLRKVVENFHLKGVNICNIRAEDAARNFLYREKCDHVTARAVARMNSLSEYCLPLVKKGGTFIAYKSGDLTEIDEAQNAYKTLGGTKKDVFLYTLEGGYGQRSLAVIEKVNKTPEKYPRGQGKERKNPL